ncbi:GNAT family N-acetyltransferase [Rhizobium sp. R693]|uniref:GNAT family N-acetyltransferase n=1 Tax=Rhizobium sp. R693 TaxID=1764276 RepID=UPI000B535ADE|nr:GNAT family N-acetyltransferase [Rhizobium sp. R693]OWV83206.1 arsenate reductase [Rhizobium sp. R693]
MRELKLEPIVADMGLKIALTAAALAIEDIDEPGRSYFRLTDTENQVVGYSGVETSCDNDILLRSLVILPAFRSQGYGRVLTEMTIAQAPLACDIYLVTTSAAPFFAAIGFFAVGRDQVPHAILSTRQLSGLCPASATIMKLSRPPT